MNIRGYDLDRAVYEGPTYSVHRGWRTRDKTPVLIKTAAAGQGDSAAAEESLEWEYQITSSIQVAGIMAVHELVPYKKTSALILEDTGAVPVRELLDRNGLESRGALAVAVKLAAILGALHKEGLIHKAIHPCNVFVHPKTEDVALTGLTAASRLTDEVAAAAQPGLSLDALAYLSPEQTGRMNRRVSHQADLYSVGVLLYEMLTGRVPFEAGDVMELIHAHIAVQPDPPLNVRPEVPRATSDIVMKLLSKAAEDRYQSALGLRVDLEACLEGRAGPGFVPGRHDVSDQIRLPEKLYGRADEIDILMSAFDRVSDGGAEMLLVSGYSGIGKSALVNEVQKAIVRRRGHFISGKFDQFKRNVPHSAIIGAFQELTRQLLTESESEVAAWGDRIRGALDESGQVVINVIPEIELIVGPQPGVPDLPPAEARNRFNLVFERFIKAFTRDDHPLVLFLDDLQWADAATLDLLQSLASDPTLRHLLIIGAYRDNEVGAGHPLLQTVSEVEAGPLPVSRILLTPLGGEDLRHLAADTLRCSSEKALPLARLVHEKTQGNPFFVIQFIKALHTEGLLSFDHASGAWTYDLAAIRGTGITDNVVDLMVRKIEQLPEAAQQAVTLAACIGNRFDLHTLAIASQASHGEAAADLREAVLQGLILPLSDVSVRLAELGELPRAQSPQAAVFRFLHDRVQQAAYALIPDDEKQVVHLRVGRLMLQHRDEAALDEQLFEIVGHLNLGGSLVTDPVERLRLVELNLRAGRKARVSTAFESGLRYFEEGIRRLPDEAWTLHYELAFALHLERAECEYLCGGFDQAERQLEDLLDRARSALEKAEIYRIRIVEYENTSRFAEARDWGKTGLALFGIVFPEGAAERQAMLEAEIRAIDSLVGSRGIEDLVELPVMTDDAVRLSMKLLMTMWAPSYISGDMMLTSLIAAKMVHLSVRHGNVEESTYGYVTYAATVMLRLGDYVASHAYGKLALAVNEKFGDLTARAKVNHMFSCYIQLWCGPIESCFPYSREAYRAGLASGDFIYAAYGVYHESWHALFSGQPLDQYHEQYSAYLAVMTRMKNQAFFDAHQQVLHVSLALQGRTEGPFSLTSQGFDEAAYLDTFGRLGFFGSIYYVCKLQLLYLFGQYDDAARFAQKAQEVAPNTEGMIWDAWRGFYQALTLLARYPSLSADARPEADEEIGRLCSAMRTWAENGPESFSHRYDLVLAEAAAVRGDVDGATKGYERAVAGAAKHRFIQVEALANERYALFWLRRGNAEVARLYFAAARDCYTRWGATAKVTDLQTRYADYVGGPSSRTAGGPGPDALDLTTVMRSAQVISGEVARPQLLGKLLSIVLENAGAQKGSLLLEREGTLLIEAEGSATGEVTVLQAVPAESSGRLAFSVIRYVARVGEHVVLADATRDSRFSKDPYIQTEQPLSLLCAPILHQGRPIGLLYLENNLVRDAFTPNRIEVVGILASQAAISLANARLYEEMTLEVAERKTAEEALQRARDDLEVRVAGRTDELFRANEQLQQEVGERRQVEVRLQTAKEAAEAANQAKSEFLAHMSHELRTPLNAILGYAQILQGAGQLADPQRRGVDTIQRSGEHLLTLIDDILSLSKIEAGKMELAPTDFHLRAFLEGIADIARVRAEQKGLSFRYEAVSALPTAVRGDERRLRQVLLNLLGNAAKFTDRGGVHFRVSSDMSSSDSSRLRFEVEDTGIGVPRDKVEEMFEPFQQVHRPDRPGEGTGLGLAISNRLVKLMGGSIGVRSTPGEGSLFWVELTLPASVPSDVAAPPRRITGFEGQPTKLLVVDDKAENRAVLIGLLSPLGFALAEAGNGQEALEKTASWRPDLILMDLVMPVMDGFEATRRIRHSSARPDVVIVAMSASVFENSRQRSHAAGCDGFIPKPVQAQLLFDKLQRFLGLDWIYDQESQPRMVSGSGAGAAGLADLAVPPSDTLETLRQLAMRGDIRDLLEHLKTIERADSLFLPFVTEVHRLAADYDMQGITDFIGRHQDENDELDHDAD